jgi:hypothetical protein
MVVTFQEFLRVISTLRAVRQLNLTAAQIGMVW